MASVYFVQAGENGPIKIGRTNGSIWHRIRALQTAHHEELRLVAAYNHPSPVEVALAERDFHSCFDAYRIRGEWFEPSEEVLDSVRALAVQ